MSKSIRDLRVGTIVVAIRDLDPSGAAVRAGTLGVVYMPADSDPGFGPLVRWLNMGTCNIYEGDVNVIS